MIFAPPLDKNRSAVPAYGSRFIWQFRNHVDERKTILLTVAIYVYHVYHSLKIQSIFRDAEFKAVIRKL